VAHDGACSPNVSVKMAWISFGALLYREKKLDDNSHLRGVEIARVAWHASFQPLWQEKTCNSAHEQTPLSNNTIDSVLRHGDVGRAKDLPALPRRSILKTAVQAAYILRNRTEKCTLPVGQFSCCWVYSSVNSCTTIRVIFEVTITIYAAYDLFSPS